MKVARDEQTLTTSQTADPVVVEHDDTICDISYDSDTELDISGATTSSLRSSCTSCNGMKKRIKSLQKRISWYKKEKATLQKKLRKLEAENPNTSLPRVPTLEDQEDSEDSDDGERSQDECSMDYSSLEESSSHSAAEMNEDITRNTVR
jgi:hypothetical protein